MANCYECKHRGTIPGDCHSTCRHPIVGANDFMEAIMKVASGDIKEALDKLEIQIDPYGFRMGWAYWPAGFDPIWIKNCNGFEGEKK